MSDEIQTPTQVPASTPAPDDRQVLLEELKLERTSLMGKLKESEASMASLIRERDTFKENLSKLEPKAQLADKLQLQVEGYINQGRETALMDKIRASLPGADPLALRGAVIALAESGRAQRYPEDANTEAAKLLDLIKQEAPGLTRPATTAGGSSAVKAIPSPPQQRASLFR